MKYDPLFLEELETTDPEFSGILENLAMKETVAMEAAQIPEDMAMMAVLAALAGAQGYDVLKTMIPLALKELTPVQIKEIAYQSCAYLGAGKALPFLRLINEVFVDMDIALPLEKQGTVAMEERREAGTRTQMELFGPQMENFWKGGDINYLLASNCFGDYYTRSGLAYRERELVTFCFLAGQGGCEPQLTSHAAANMMNGNSADFLRRIVIRCVPYIGYPRSLNALSCIKAAEEQQEAHG